MFELEYPTSFRHLLKILWTIHEKKAFALSNPDGYFYLLYLKMLAKFFFCNFVISGGVVMGISVYSNSKGNGDLDIDQSSWYDLTSLSFSLDDQLVYYISLIMAIFTTVLAYLFMLDFCDEMTRFEFQPDQKIMDQFIQMHTLMIKGINPNMSPEKAMSGIGKVFSLRFGSKNILRIQVFRPVQNLKKIVGKRKNMKKKLKKAKKSN